MLHINMIFHVRDYHFRSHKLHYITMGKVIYPPQNGMMGLMQPLLITPIVRINIGIETKKTVTISF